MTPYLSIAIHEPSQVGEARRAAARLAGDLGFDETRGAQVSLAVTELATNLVRHATGGRMLLGRASASHQPCIDLLSVDVGPGMPDVARCLVDGYSTGGTPGNGLGAVKRLSDAFSVHSSAGKGSIVLSRIGKVADVPGPAPSFDVAGISVAAAGESVSGDAWRFSASGSTGRVLVADGLGHGPVAAEAADGAVAVFDKASGKPSQVLAAAHAALRSTRGAAVAMAELDAATRTVTICGAGNIACRLVSGKGDRSLLSQHGTLGLQIRKLTDIVYPWPPHACLVVHSDGITTRWNFADAPGLLQCDVAVIAAWLLREHSRGRDDATVVVIRTR